MICQCGHDVRLHSCEIGTCIAQGCTCRYFKQTQVDHELSRIGEYIIEQEDRYHAA